ncbi:MAG: hypothetical protein RLZZ623_3222 [Actinomycetota bacterium]|jgi:uncharacterized protein
MTNPGYEFDIHVRPGSRRTSIDGIHDDVLAVRVSAPPADGRANEAVCELLATAFGVRRSIVSIDRGAASRRKHVRIETATPLDAARLEATHRALLAGSTDQ